MSNSEAILLLIISLGAFLIPFVSKKLLLPSAVGEIIFGLTLGMFFKDVIHQFPIVKFLGEFGFIILMYLAGLEIDVDKIRKTKKKDQIVIFSVFVIIIAVSFFIVYFFGFPTIYALVFLATAIGLLYPVLKDTKLLNTEFGQKILIIASIGEIISLLVIIAFTVFLKDGISFEFLIHLVEIYIFFLFSYLLLKIFYLFIWWNPKLIRNFLKTGDVTESGIRANFANMFIFVSLASLLGLEPIIGAFFGGLLFAMVFKEREEIVEKMSAFGYGFLIPIFFIEVGLRFELTEFFHLQIILQAILLSLMILFVKTIGSVFLIFEKFNWKQILVVPFGFSMPLTLLIVIATLGLELNIITKEQASVILLTAIISALVYPFIFKVLVKKLNLG